MTVKAIEKEIAAIDAKLAEIDVVNENEALKMSRANRAFETELKAYLSDAGFPMNKYTELTVYPKYSGEDSPGVVIRFRAKERGTDFIVEFKSNKVYRLNTSGMSVTAPDSGDIEDFGAYYKMVSDVTEKVTSKYFATNMSLFFDSLDNHVAPKTKFINDNDLKAQKRELERELEVAKLDLRAGVEVEVAMPASRWSRTRWVPFTIEKITAKTVVLDSPRFPRKVIKLTDVTGLLRPVQK